jgi:serine/threonine-protein kinase
MESDDGPAAIADDPRIRQLLAAALESNRTPDEVCAGSPDLLPEVRRRWDHCRLVDAHLKALFPSTSRPSSLRERSTGDFPRIPGYEVEAVLGRGGVGVVYQARHLLLGRPVAVKMLLRGEYASGVEVARFNQEARTLAGLRHPHIVQVHDVGECDGLPFFTMEFLEGGTLAQRLAGVPQPPRQAAALLATLCDAIDTAHRAGIVHRDLKPANVLLADEGTPKVSDFGLARCSAAEADERLTLTGQRIGTPSYMAPEQASRQFGSVGPAADIYALGAILYEMLTGRPPFHGESAAETERQLLAEDPVPPSRLNARVPRDLETICLKCLRKDPSRRYGAAAALADDLRRFQKGEPISARPTGTVERAAKWVKRRPAAATALAAAALLAISLIGGSLWLVSQRAANNKAVAQDLQEAVQQQKLSNWALAESAMDRAALRLGDHGPGELHQILDQARRDATLVARLDHIHFAYQASVGGSVDYAHADRDYADAFREAGLGTDQEDPQAVAARVKNSNIQTALIGALDHWSCAVPSAARQKWISDVVRQADRDPTGFRDRVRSLAIWDHGSALAKAMNDASTETIAGQPATFLLAVGFRLVEFGKDDGPLVLKAQQTHPSDFALNIRLGVKMLDKHDIPAGLGYFQAAMSLRPDVAMGHHNFGVALADSGRFDEAIIQYRQALVLDPTAVATHYNLGVSLHRTGQSNQAIPELEEAIRLSPNEGLPYVSLGVVLADLGRYPEALDRTRQALALRPTGSLLAAAQGSIRTFLRRMGKPDESLDAWTAQLQSSPTDRELWDGYAEYCLFIGREAEYRHARESLLDLYGDSQDPQTCDVMGRACLLMPASGDVLRRATAMIDRALPDPSKRGGLTRYYKVAKGLAEYRAGHFQSANFFETGDASQVLGPAPGIVAAMAQYRLGRVDEARQTLDRAVRGFDWGKMSQGDSQTWMYHILRREAEALILANPVS